MATKEARHGDGRMETGVQVIRLAEFSKCHKYRFTLTRIWEPDAIEKPMLGLIGKNPSVADKERDDPTIGKEIALGKRLGCRGLLKLNVYPWIATDSSELVSISERTLVGDWTVDKFAPALSGCSPVVCCWGTHSNKAFRERLALRGEMIVQRLHGAGIKTFCLKQNADASPAHPLYLPTNLKLQEY